eukprot:1278453-Rhodomonas_salina.2
MYASPRRRTQTQAPSLGLARTTRCTATRQGATRTVSAACLQASNESEAKRPSAIQRLNPAAPTWDPYFYYLVATASGYQRIFVHRRDSPGSTLRAVLVLRRLPMPCPVQTQRMVLRATQYCVRAVSGTDRAYGATRPLGDVR